MKHRLGCPWHVHLPDAIYLFLKKIIHNPAHKGRRLPAIPLSIIHFFMKNTLAYIRGNLVGVHQESDAAPVTLKLLNDLPIFLNIYTQVNGQSVRKGRCLPATFTPGKPDEWNPGSGEVKGVTLPCVLIVTTATTGSLVTVLEVAETVPIHITYDHLTRPNALGSPPEPEYDRPDPIFVPQNTARVVVGIGFVLPFHPIIREQYWQRLGDSFTLAPGEEITLTTTHSAGITSTSSTSETIAKTLGMDASAGWGPISLGINASLSSTSTNTQQVTIADEITTHESRTMRSTSDQPVVYFRWQVVDVISIIATQNSEKLQHVVITEQDPAITTGPFPSDRTDRQG